MDSALSWDDVAAAAESRWAASTLPGTDWQRGFRDALARVVDAWHLTPVHMFSTGVGVPVVEVVAAGLPAVVKLAPPAELNHQAAVMVADDARSHARVLDHDAQAAAMLLEVLGEPVEVVVDDPLDRYALVADTLSDWWQLPLDLGADIGSKATGLLGIFDVQGAQFGRDFPVAIDAAREVAEHLAATEAAEVVCHGDPHTGNLLQHGESGWRFVDPDGFRGERAYDLGVVIRGESDRVLRLEQQQPGAGAAFVRRSAEVLAEHSGVDVERIWQWGFVERVTSGLYLRMLGHDDEGLTYLATATALAPS